MLDVNDVNGTQAVISVGSDTDPPIRELEIAREDVLCAISGRTVSELRQR